MRHFDILVLLCAASGALVSAREPDHPTVPIEEARPSFRHLRSLDLPTAGLIRSGYHRSPTIRRLVERLESLDIIVYVEQRTVHRMGVGGYLTVVSNPTMPLVRIVLDPQIARPFLIGLLGHELQHAVEVAEAGVRDRDELRRLYEAIGFEGPVERSYESGAARQVERAVVRELGLTWG